MLFGILIGIGVVYGVSIIGVVLAFLFSKGDAPQDVEI